MYVNLPNAMRVFYHEIVMVSATTVDLGTVTSPNTLKLLGCTLQLFHDYKALCFRIKMAPALRTRSSAMSIGLVPR